MEEEINREVAAFLTQLTALGGQLSEIYKTGNLALIGDMNKTVREMYRVQHGSEQAELAAVGEQCEIIYKNFDMMIAVLKTTENGEIDRGAQTAIGKFLHNINEATVDIASIYGLI